VTTWFASVAPVGVLLSLIGFILDYWITKALLAKVYKIPENISEDIASPSLMGLELLPLVYICGVLQFSYKVSSNSDIFQFFYDFLHYGITTLVILLSVCGYLIFCKKEL
jgi:di/tricarboxylate transporter